MHLNNEKTGLMLVLASLLVMCSTAYLLIENQLTTQEQHTREQSLALVRLISTMPWSQIAIHEGKGLLDILSEGQSNPDFSYAQIINLDNKIVKEVTTRGTIVPAIDISVKPSDWVGIRELASINQAVTFIESYAPLFLNGEHKGFVKLGYRQPVWEFTITQLAFIATFILPIFLLAPLFYYSLRQQLRPLGEISSYINELNSGVIVKNIEPKPNSGVQCFINEVNCYIESTQLRIHELDEQHSDQYLSGKLLSYQNNKMEMVLQTLPDSIVILDKDNVVTYANQKFCTLLELNLTDILNHKPNQWCTSGKISSLLSDHHNKGASMVFNGSDLSSNGANFNKKFEINAYPLFSSQDDAQLLGKLLIISDETKFFLEQQQQAGFISQIAHELKTPLNVLSMYSEVLIDKDLASEDMLIEAANVIHDEVERLNTLIKNLMTISQYELGGLFIKRQRVRIQDFLKDIFDTMSKSDQANEFKFELNLPQEICAIQIDKALMTIALNNLLSNAIKYNHKGQTITLEARETQHSVEITVSDEGYGISEEDQLHIFDKFFRSNDTLIRNQTGHGLGLSLACQIVQIHQGKISVNSTLEKGSSFKITLDKRLESITDRSS